MDANCGVVYTTAANCGVVYTTALFPKTIDPMDFCRCPLHS
jgi:hypothetical protein